MGCSWDSGSVYVVQQLSRIDSNCRLLTAIGTIPSLDGFYIAGLPASARPSIPHERLLSTAKTLQSSDFTVYRHTCQYANGASDDDTLGKGEGGLGRQWSMAIACTLERQLCPVLGSE